jgi:hypothetical protein
MVHTGGFSSTSSLCEGLALRFANTPSLALPEPYSRVVVVAKAGYCATLVSTAGAARADDASGCDCTKRCRSSASSSSSSEPPGVSKASASARSSSSSSGSCASSSGSSAEGEAGREENGGGGEAGTRGGGPSTWSESSRVATCGGRHVRRAAEDQQRRTGWYCRELIAAMCVSGKERRRWSWLVDWAERGHRGGWRSPGGRVRKARACLWQAMW